MTIGQAALSVLAGKALDGTARVLSDLRRESRGERVSIDDSRSRECLVAHVGMVDVWSATIALLTLLRDKRLRESFVQLSLDIGLRRDEKRQHGRQAFTVDEIADGSGHVVILGRPGAGKTTSLQRIAQTALEKWETGRGGVPLLVRLRDLRRGDNIVRYLLALVGLGVKVPTHATQEMRRAWEMRALGRYLDSIAAVVLIDGLDEVQPFVRQDIEADLKELILVPGAHRIFLTCRTAEYTVALPNSQTYTILPLSADQIEEFATRWLGDTAPEFMRAVAQNPYAGTEVVPLTLAHLCAIYERDGELPPRPIDVYEQIVSLLVEEWDKERRIVRTSRYADFSWRKKERFLQAAAYYLAIRGQKGSFWNEDLEQVYREIAPEFNLPPDDAEQVVGEVESHTGLIREVGHGQYEFAHLVIQEYLAAMYAHRRVDAVPHLIPAFPNEMALVIAYSASANEHLEQALEVTLLHVPAASASFIIPFLARVGVEKPLWRADARLGWTILAFFDLAARHFREVDDRQRLRLPPESLELLRAPAIAESVRYAAAEAEVFEQPYAALLIPKHHRSMPPFLHDFLTGRKDAGISVLRTEPVFRKLLRQKRKAPIGGRKHPR
ncbi:MAG: NACHT domain-containing protein [Gemmatimonadota bacterium]|nr:NACHT domain-containing protein [Gemmatimonadota bacterium]